tara:strand:- start:1546 stop:2439 length:894 start_codon:yes stop_codon:yes gene_type:complete
MKKTIIGVLMGGPDAEREISINSGNAVADALESNGTYVIQRHLINEISTEELIAMEVDIFFPVLHGPYGEGGPLQEALELSETPFVGNPSSPAKLCLNKIRSKEKAIKLGIQTPAWNCIKSTEDISISLPLVLKPINEGSSVNVAICKSQDDINAFFNDKPNHQTFLAESYVQGQEITISIVDKVVLPTIEIIPPSDRGTYDFEAKYMRNDTKYLTNPKLPKNNCVKDALKIYESFQLRDVARIDFIVNESGGWLLEINTMPGFTENSLLPMAAKETGMSMQALCVKLVELALKRSC